MATERERSVRGGAFRQFGRWVFGVGYERNVGGTERAVRYTAGALCLALALAVLGRPGRSGSRNWVLSSALCVTGAYLVYEARVQYCPLNHALGRSTYAED